jgi:hypothetical protein
VCRTIFFCEEKTHFRNELLWHISRSKMCCFLSCAGLYLCIDGALAMRHAGLSCLPCLVIPCHQFPGCTCSVISALRGESRGKAALPSLHSYDAHSTILA